MGICFPHIAVCCEYRQAVHFSETSMDTKFQLIFFEHHMKLFHKKTLTERCMVTVCSIAHSCHDPSPSFLIMRHNFFSETAGYFMPLKCANMVSKT